MSCKQDRLRHKWGTTSMDHARELKNEWILSESDKREAYWMLDDTHFSRPLTPLFASFMLPGVTKGTKRAFENMRMPIQQFVAKCDRGYYYQSMPPHPEPFEERMPKHKRKMEEYYPQIKAYLDRVVNEFFMPFYHRLEERSIRPLTSEEALQGIEELQSFYERAWQYHFEITIPRTSLAVELEEAYRKVTGYEDGKGVYELLQGVMNMSLETDRGIWELANHAKTSASLRAVLADNPNPAAELELTADGREFLKDLRDFLSIYGHRTTATHEFAEATWYEDPTRALSLIASYVHRDYDFDAVFQQVSEERKAKAAEFVSRLPEGEDKDRFCQLYRWALGCWGADEDHHFYIDAMLPAKARYFLKNVGRTLVRHHAIRSEEDIFFLYLDEVIEALRFPRDLQQVADENRRGYEANRDERPHASYGPLPPSPQDPIVERIFGSYQEADRPARSIKGYAASPGLYTGVARILRGEQDFDKLGQGDILVCSTLTPSWTILFSLAGAVVTDTGGILSHASIVAREYKLPAVVGTRTATSVLRDGDVITVDGATGLVHAGWESNR